MSLDAKLMNAAAAFPPDMREHMMLLIEGYQDVRLEADRYRKALEDIQALGDAWSAIRALDALNARSEDS